MSGHTVAVQFIRSAAETATQQGLDIGQALRDARIPPELVGRDETRVTPEQAVRLVRSLWETTDDELLGAGPRPVPRGTFRMISLGVIHAGDLGTALRRYVDFARIAVGLEQAELSVGEEVARFSIGSVGDAPKDQFVVDVLIAVVHRFASWLIGEQIDLAAVELPYPAPPHAEEYALIYGVDPRFDTPVATMAFDTRYLSAPVIRDEEALRAFIRNSPADLLFRRDYHPTIASKVRKVVERGRTGELVTTDEAAKRLAVSPQHLRRLLRDEGTSFRAIKEEILRDEAIASLVAGTETVEDLSDRLGFSEPSAFRRAFRRWTGSPPGSYRPDTRGSVT